MPDKAKKIERQI